jgi:hypothetical protein
MPGFILALLLSTVSVVGVGKSFHAGLPHAQKLKPGIIGRLDVIMKFRDDLDWRWPQLEGIIWTLTQDRVDGHGVIHSFNGRPVGYWGIDGPLLKPLRQAAADDRRP